MLLGSGVFINKNARMSQSRIDISQSDVTVIHLPLEHWVCVWHGELKTNGTPSCGRLFYLSHW